MSGERPSRAGSRRTEVSQRARVLVLLGFLGLVIASALSRSDSPTVLGRYSTLSFGYQVLNLAIAALLALPSRWVGTGARQVGYALVVVSTFLAPVNGAIRNWPGTGAAMPALRLLAAGALIAVEFDRYRAGKSTRGVIVGAAALLVAVSILDLALWVRVWSSSGFEEDYGGFRDRYALGAITPDDIVLVGDSFVWGHGVPKEKRFGDMLERLYAREGRRVRVYSLGVRGAGPSRYLESLALVPPDRRAGVVILSFYPNDMGPRPRPRSRALHLIQLATWRLGWSSLSFRVLHDLLGKLEIPSLDHYHRQVVEDFQRDESTFPRRWEDLIRSITEFEHLARQRSTSRPLFLIIPLMVDFRDYPLSQAHGDLRKAAEGAGYDVLDLLPAFLSALGDGARFRVSRNDNHFDARVHELVATLIKRHLDGRESGQ
jgi:hypothetical protein